MRSVVPLVLLVALPAAGCGGGSTGTTTTRDETQPNHQPPTKADYIAVGDTICRNHQSRREDLESQASDLGRISSLRQEERQSRRGGPELAGLQPPSADADTVVSILSLLRAEANVIIDWAKAYDDLHSEAIRSLQIRLGVIAAKGRDRARAYGFKVCGQQ